MINPREHMIIIDGKICTESINSCHMSEYGYSVTFNKNPTKTYSYKGSRLLCLCEPTIYDPQLYQLFRKGHKLESLAYISVFSYRQQHFWHLEYENGATANYHNSEITMVESCLTNEHSKSAFGYLRHVAAINKLKSEDDNSPLLLRQYQSIDFIGDDRAAAPYLNPEEFKPQTFVAGHLIYPFGCNASQQKAIKAAFENQISVIQGPPGTGKTQTILNIVANIILQGKSVLVVSNNNSAIANIVEKLDKYGIGFISALLGNRHNKDIFISTQNTTKQIPSDIAEWHTPAADNIEYLQNIDATATALHSIFAKQERIAIARQEIDALQIEQAHFEKDANHNSCIKLRTALTSVQLMSIWSTLQARVEHLHKSGIFAKLLLRIKDYLLNRQLQKLFDGINSKLSDEDLISLITVVQSNIYIAKLHELKSEIESLNKDLTKCDADKTAKDLRNDSMTYLRNYLYHKYGKEHERPIFTIRSMGANMLQEYPVILSTTFSARTNFSRDTVFDYVIMDEASQISSETGTLALLCAHNAVIVGDSMQLTNVLTEEERLIIQTIASQYDIEENYDCANNNFLQSICKVIPTAPQTLLREHYRCHPKIINFCNQKFYGGNLVIMTSDNGEKDVISAIKTVQGNHARNHVNQREISVIREEIIPTIPTCDRSKIGIISPYRRQIEALTAQIDPEIEIDTVHKFQGREKDVIIISTVDNQKNDFSDNPNLLNVAISRAKQKLYLVTTGNKQNDNSNIGDLLAYIEYNNFSVRESKIHSIFDLLYKQYTKARIEFLANRKKVSEYDSENLTYAVIDNILQKNEYRYLDVVCHFPLYLLIKDFSLLNEREYFFVKNQLSHIDFLIYNKVSKLPVLAIETNGSDHLKAEQIERDQTKKHILDLYEIAIEQLDTTGDSEEKKIDNRLKHILKLT